jgi:hypothetical protein
VTDTWIVIVEDRHSSVDALPFSTPALAVAHAYTLVPDGTEPAPRNDDMILDGWMLYLPYGTEGDCVRVIRRAVDGG